MSDFSAVVDFAIFENQNRQGKQPHRRGNFEMSKALLKEMVELAKKGETPILQIACWENKSKKGTEYLGCKLSIDAYRMEKAAQENGSDAEEEEDDIFG